MTERKTQQGLLSLVRDYVAQSDLSYLPGWNAVASWTVLPLAQGEYNVNFVLKQGSLRWVLRVNMASQIGREDQIEYEYQTLALLQPTGVTPVPYAVEREQSPFSRGCLWMEYLPGRPLDYQSDLEAVAELFGRLHSVSAHLGANHLIVEEAPLSMTTAECRILLVTYWKSKRSDLSIGSYLRDVLDWAEEAKARERYLVEDPWPCVINTEVNSGNFICEPNSGALHLVDWEKALWGDPSQDLSHFCAPTTTLWKTDVRLSEQQRRSFLERYKRAVPDVHLRSTIEERVALRDPFNRLRGVSWTAMAWVKYQTGEQPVRNPDTFRKMESYLDLVFLRGLFDEYIERGA